MKFTSFCLPLLYLDATDVCDNTRVGYTLRGNASFFRLRLCCHVGHDNTGIFFNMIKRKQRFDNGNITTCWPNYVIPLHTVTRGLAESKSYIASGSTMEELVPKGRANLIVCEWFGCKTSDVQQTRRSLHQKCRKTVTTKGWNTQIISPPQVKAPSWVTGEPKIPPG